MIRCFGKVTDSGFRVIYPPDSVPGLLFGRMALHPVQIYEAILLLLLGGLLLGFARRSPPLGALAAAYMAGFGMMRFSTGLMRGDFRPVLGGMSWVSLHGLLLLACGLALIVLVHRSPSRTKRNQ